MDFEAARAAVYARLKTVMDANHPAVPVLYENRLNIDLATQTGPFVACEILFNDGEQKSMESAPVVAYSGAIWLAVANKQGEGVAATLQVLSTLANNFKTVTFGGVVAQAPRPLPGYLKDGWYFEPLRVPFYFNDIPA